MSTKLPRLDNSDDDMPPLIREDQLSPDNPSSPIHIKKSTKCATHSTAYYESTPIPDFLDQAGKYYQSHQAQCFKNNPTSTPIMTIIYKVARRLEIIWYNSHPFTPPSFLHCMQTILESEQSMIPIRLDAIRRLIPVHTVVTEHTKRLQLAWNPESTLIISAINMDKTNDIFLPYDFTKHPAARTELAKSLIEDCATNPKLLDTYSFAPDFNARIEYRVFCVSILNLFY